MHALKPTGSFTHPILKVHRLPTGVVGASRFTFHVTSVLPMPLAIADGHYEGLR